jgi:lipid A disaccharide synthetase
MANLLLGYECYGEYIQNDANPEVLARQLKLLTNARQEFATVSDELFHCLSQREQTVADWLSQE